MYLLTYYLLTYVTVTAAADANLVSDFTDYMKQQSADGRQ